MNKRFLWTIFTAVAAVAVSAFAMHAIQTERVLTNVGRIKSPDVNTVSVASPILSEITTSDNTLKSLTVRRPGSSLPVVKEIAPTNENVSGTPEIRDPNQNNLWSRIRQREYKGFEKVPLPANVPELDFNLPAESEDRGHSTLDATCVLTNSGTPYWLEGAGEGDVVKVWFTPRQCAASWSPFRIDSVGFYLYASGAGTFVFQVDIECPMTPYDSTTGPAYQLSHPDSNVYSITFPTGGGNGWINVKLHPAICVNHGFFVGLRFGSWSGNSADYPSFLTDNYTTQPIPWGKQWVCRPGCCDWRTYSTYYRICARVRGNTVDGCSPVTCSTTAPCVVTCQTGDSIEATENADSTWMSHDPNGGCFVSPPLFGHAPCGSWVCGKLFTYTGAAYYHNDYDWYIFTLTERDSVRLTVVTEFPVVAGIVDTNQCTDAEWLSLVSGSENCSTVVRTGCLDPGTYAFLVMPGNLTCPTYPGADYRARVECFPCQSCPPPANDDCANATTITCPATDVQVDLACATQDCDSLDYPEVWYKFYLDPSTYSAWTVGVSWCGTDPSIISIATLLFNACPCAEWNGSTGASSFNCGSPSWLSDTIYFENVPAGWWYMPVSTNLGTTAVFDLFCEEYVACTPIPPNDDCADVTPVGLPATFTGDNHCATHDCNGLTEGQGETWHAFTIDEQCDVIIDYCGTNPAFRAFYAFLIQSCPCSTAINATTSDFTTCGDDNITMRFNYLQPGTYYLPVMRSDLDTTGGPYTIHVYCAPTCSLTCPPGAVNEVEQICSAGFVDYWNGGCFSDPPVFASINCGQTVCGHSGTFVANDTMRGRDTDWYRLNLSQKSFIQWTAVAQFPVELVVFDSTDCNSRRVLAAAAALTCDTAIATTAALEAGEYWLRIAPNQFMYVECGVEYVAWVTCTPCSVTCLATDVIECAETPDSIHIATDCNGGCSVDPAQYQELICGQSVCGIGFTYHLTDSTYTWDRDWYHFTLADSQIVTATLEAEFPADVYILNYDCNDVQVLEAVTSEIPCAPVTLITASALPPGDYTLYVAPSYDWIFDYDGWAPYPSRYRVTLGCPCPPAINTTVYWNTGATNLVVRWIAPAAGTYKVFSTLDKTISFDPFTWTTETTVTVGSGLNTWTDPDAVQSYKRYVVQRICQ